MVLGAIFKCPSCDMGFPKFDFKKGIYKCPGYMDDNDMIRCNKVMTMEDF